LRQKQPLDGRFRILGRGLATGAGGAICDAVERSLAQPGYAMRPIMVA
jgi:hypothetical protein